VNDWWGEIDSQILKALEGEPMTPADVGQRLGMSERAAASLLWSLASQGKVRIRLVELVTASPSR